jgi:hypothetical protein
MEALKLTMWCYTPAKDFTLKAKSFLKMSPTVLGEYQEHVSKNVEGRYNVDGYIFVPEDDPVVFGRHDAMFKLKTHHTVDFLVKNGKICVYDDKNKRNKAVGEAGGTKKALAIEGSIVECELVGSQWHVLGVRSDKSRPNTKFVFDKTMLNMKENLSIVDIVNAMYG